MCGTNKVEKRREFNRTRPSTEQNGEKDSRSRPQVIWDARFRLDWFGLVLLRWMWSVWNYAQAEGILLIETILNGKVELSL